MGCNYFNHQEQFRSFLIQFKEWKKPVTKRFRWVSQLTLTLDCPHSLDSRCPRKTKCNYSISSLFSHSTSSPCKLSISNPCSHSNNRLLCCNSKSNSQWWISTHNNKWRVELKFSSTCQFSRHSWVQFRLVKEHQWLCTASSATGLLWQLLHLKMVKMSCVSSGFCSDSVSFFLSFGSSAVFLSALPI